MIKNKLKDMRLQSVNHFIVSEQEVKKLSNMNT